eukprot:Nitzschia sp. Nitz4//scaffold126_size65214//61806//62780//NITZ4_006169-RA/size65214-processed-gene-0.45-mRNA-1//-1//CDS//3329534728//3580//frame0
MAKAVQFIPKSNTINIVQVDKPTELEGQDLLIKVKSTALDTGLDPVIQKTLVGGFIHATTDPLYLGWHFGGVVEKVGSSVTEFQVGNEVYGFLQYAPDTKQGALADYIVVKEDACALKPKVQWDTAVASSTEGLTALQSLRDLGGLVDGGKQCVLVNGAGGQVGSLAVQIAKRMGCHVTAICSTKDVVRVTKLGADVVVDRKKTDNVYSKLSKNQFDVIFDTPNALSTAKCLKYLKRGGSVVVTLPTMSMLWGMIVAMFSSKSVKFVEVAARKKDLELFGKWLEEGFQVEVDSVFDVKDIAKAVARNREPGTKGRVIVHVEDKW